VQLPADDSEQVRSDVIAEGIETRTFETFYEDEYWPVVRLAAALTGRWDVAEELAQEGFLAIHRQWSRISSYDSPEAWLRRVVLNRSLSAMRRRTVEARLAMRLARQRRPSIELPPAAGDVWRLVAALPKRQAEVVALVFVEDRSVADAAALLGCEETTVRTHLRRARIALARDLGVPDEGEG